MVNSRSIWFLAPCSYNFWWVSLQFLPPTLILGFNPKTAMAVGILANMMQAETEKCMWNWACSPSLSCTPFIPMGTCLGCPARGWETNGADLSYSICLHLFEWAHPRSIELLLWPIRHVLYINADVACYWSFGSL